MTDGIALARRFRRASIRSRVVLLAAGIVAGIVVANYVLLSELRSNAAVAKRQAALFVAYADASDAVEAFGDLKYWLTDLAVSQLVLSERNAAAAESRFQTALAALQTIEPAAVAEIEADLAVLKLRAGEAALAYEAASVQPEKRVIGNSLMADARRSISAIDVRLAAVSDGLAAQSAAGREAMVASADDALWTLLRLFAVLVGASVLATLGVVHTIVRPLKIMHEAVGRLTAGERDVAIPVDAPAEVAAVGRSLELFRDSVAERDRLAAAEVRQRQILSDAIETIGEGFALFDAADRLIVSNSQLEAIFPASAHAIAIGTGYDALFRSIAVDAGAATAAPKPWLEEQRRLHDAGGGQRAFEHADGQWVRVHERRSAGGETVVVFQDITEQKRREADLAAARDAAQAANVSKSQFIANMSHELRTPLNAIIGYSEMLREETEGLVDAEVHKDLDKIRNAGKHLLALINDVLDLSKIEAGKMTLDTEFVDLTDLIDDVVATIRPLCDRNRNTFVLERPETLPAVWADRMRLKQSLLNLLSNACKFTADGTVTLAVEREAAEAGEVLVMAVRDTGIGIARDKLDGLFQEFMQVDASATRKYGGTGLGLAISRQFCRLMGGDVTVTSTEGVGSEFAIRLPMMPRGAADAPPAIGAGDRPAVLPASGTILVIDDNEDDRTLLRRHIEREGFTVETAASGIEGLAYIRAHRPAVVTLDVKMDTLDGWTVLAAIRGDPALADLPVVMVSVVNDADRGRAMGATGFVDKPVDRDRLIMILEQLTGADGTDRRALVVDDDAPSRTVLRRGLEQRGWSVREASNGREALAAVAAERPDLIMLDLMMPETDGFEVVDQLRRDAATADIPVVIVTAKDLTSEDRDRLRAGVVTVLQKGSDSGVDVSRIVRATKLALVETGRIAPQRREPETA